MSLYLAEETFKIVGCAMEVHNTLGPGLNEKPYENALAVEFRLAGIPFKQQPPFPVLYKGNVVGECIPERIAYGKVVVDDKTVAVIGDSELGQMLTYLKVTGRKVGLIINFKHPDWNGNGSRADRAV